MILCLHSHLMVGHLIELRSSNIKCENKKKNTNNSKILAVSGNSNSQAINITFQQII